MNSDKQKYGNIAFDAGQKAVLTSCVLVNQTALSRKRKKSGAGGDRDREKEKARHREEAQINVSLFLFFLFSLSPVSPLHFVCIIPPSLFLLSHAECNDGEKIER